MIEVQSISPAHTDAHLLGLTDLECMDRLNDGDLHGLYALYGRHHRQVERFAATLAGHHVALPRAGEAFARLLVLLLDGRRPDTAVRYFLYAALRESCRQHRSLTPLAPSSSTDIPALPPEWRDLLRERAVEHLGAACRSGAIVGRITGASPDHPTSTRARIGGHLPR